MAKKQNKLTTKAKRPWGKYVLVALLLIIVLLPVTYVGYQKYLDKADADRFAKLQSDFKRLQGEFNRIDPGWEYSEGCSAAHYASGDGQPDCEVAVHANNIGKIAQEKDSLYLAAVESIIGKVSSTDSPSLKSLLRDGFTETGHSVCAISLGSADSKAYARCSSEAQDFYFTRTDQ